MRPSRQSRAQRNPAEKIGRKKDKREKILDFVILLHLVHPANSLVMDKLDGVSAFIPDEI